MIKRRSGLSYRELAQVTGFPAGALAEAARGSRMPRLTLLRAFVTGCAGQAEDPEHQWDELAARVRLPGQARLSPGLAGPAPAVTRRELDVLACLCGPAAPGAPATVREIAGELAVTDSAVKQHLAKLHRKFGITAGPGRRARLAGAVTASGLLRPTAGPGGRPVPPAPAARSSVREKNWQRADLLARDGDLHGAAMLLRSSAEDGDGYAARLLDGLLAWQGDLAELLARAEGGDPDARLLAARLAAREGTGAGVSRSPGGPGEPPRLLAGREKGGMSP
jgi:hypothetical protein